MRRGWGPGDTGRSAWQARGSIRFRLAQGSLGFWSKYVRDRMMQARSVFACLGVVCLGLGSSTNRKRVVQVAVQKLFENHLTDRGELTWPSGCQGGIWFGREEGRRRTTRGTPCSQVRQVRGQWVVLCGDGQAVGMLVVQLIASHCTWSDKHK